MSFSGIFSHKFFHCVIQFLELPRPHSPFCNLNFRHGSRQRHRPGRGRDESYSVQRTCGRGWTHARHAHTGWLRHPVMPRRPPLPPDLIAACSASCTFSDIRFISMIVDSPFLIHLLNSREEQMTTIAQKNQGVRQKRREKEHDLFPLTFIQIVVDCGEELRVFRKIGQWIEAYATGYREGDTIKGSTGEQ